MKSRVTSESYLTKIILLVIAFIGRPKIIGADRILEEVPVSFLPKINRELNIFAEKNSIFIYSVKDPQLPLFCNKVIEINEGKIQNFRQLNNNLTQLKNTQASNAK